MIPNMMPEARPKTTCGLRGTKKVMNMRGEYAKIASPFVFLVFYNVDEKNMICDLWHTLNTFSILLRFGRGAMFLIVGFGGRQSSENA